jgi:hypothetical protein
MDPLHFEMVMAFREPLRMQTFRSERKLTPRASDALPVATSMTHHGEDRILVTEDVVNRALERRLP